MEVPKRHSPMEPLHTAYNDTIAGQNLKDGNPNFDYERPPDRAGVAPRCFSQSRM